MTELYKNIKLLREKLGMSQDELALLTGYTNRSSIAKIEKGIVDLSRTKIELFAKALNVSPGELMGWEENSSEQTEFTEKTMKLAKNIRYLRKKMGLSQDDLAKKFGYKSYTTIQKWESGVSEPPFKQLTALSKLFEVDMDTLINCDLEKPDTNTENIIKKIGGVPYTTSKRIPILGYISAGLPLYAEEHIEGYTYTDLNHGSEYFALRVKGDSMTAARIFDNDILIVRKQSTVENGEIAVVIVDSENATVKRFYQKGDIVTLSPQSLNPKHLPQIYDLKQVPIRIIGKVVRNQIDFE